MPLKISINFDLETASITIGDNAAGMSPDTLEIAISPGALFGTDQPFQLVVLRRVKIGIANVGTCCKLITSNHLEEC